MGRGIYARETSSGQIAYYASVYWRGREYRLRGGSTQRKAEAYRQTLQGQIERAKATGTEWEPPYLRDRKIRRAEQRARQIPRLGTYVEKVFKPGWTAGKSSADWYSQRLKQIVRHLGRQRLDQLTLARVRRFYRSRIRETSVSTANADLKVLGIVLARAVEDGYLAQNVARQIKPDRPAEKDRPFLYAEQVEKLLEHCPPWLETLVTAALNTGLRKTALRTLTWQQVDLRRRTLRYQAKGGAWRTLPINDELVNLLRDLPRSTTSDRVFLRDGHPISPSTLTRAWSAAKKAADLPGFRFHDLRHTAASWMVIRGVSLYVVQQILGHADSRMTQRYSHLEDETIREGLAALVGYRGPALRSDPDSHPDSSKKTKRSDGRRSS